MCVLSAVKEEGSVFRSIFGRNMSEDTWRAEMKAWSEMLGPWPWRWPLRQVLDTIVLMYATVILQVVVVVLGFAVKDNVVYLFKKWKSS